MVGKRKFQMIRRWACVAILMGGFAAGAIAATRPAGQERTRWFSDAKFGMFIHWGVYSMLGRHEWVRELCQIPLAEYQEYADRFNPVRFRPDQWVDLAREAGIKYMVITSKHHDGFCIFDSRYTDYGIMHSAYGKDALGMLAKAARRKGMPLGFYYSIMDWHHPDYLPRRPWETDRSSEGANLERYVTQYMKKQVEELVVKYDPAVLWFDGEWEHSNEEQHAAEVESMLLQLKPSILINDRLFKRAPGHGDFGTPENYVPATGVRNEDGTPRLWEACYTMNFNSWGYNHYETEFHSATQLIRQLVEIVSKGGNLLLNVGPTPEGEIQPEFVARLKTIGSWLKTNGDSIYGTRASVFASLPFFGRCTVRDNRLYLHVMGWPADRTLRLPGLKTDVKGAHLLADPVKALAFRRSGRDVTVELPKRALDPDDTVVVIELAGPPEVENASLSNGADGRIELPVCMADIQSQMGQRAYLDHFYRTTLLTNWQSIYDYPQWEFESAGAATYEVQVGYARGGAVGSSFAVEIDDIELPAVTRSTPSEMIPDLFSVGTISLKKGKHQLRVRIRNVLNNSAMNLEKVVLIPLSR